METVWEKCSEFNLRQACAQIAVADGEVFDEAIIAGYPTVALVARLYEVEPAAVADAVRQLRVHYRDMAVKHREQEAKRAYWREAKERQRTMARLRRWGY